MNNCEEAVLLHGISRSFFGVTVVFPIAQQEHGLLQKLREKPQVVVGPFLVGITVPLGSNAGEFLFELLPARCSRAFEHHMFEKMSYA